MKIKYKYYIFLTIIIITLLIAFEFSGPTSTSSNAAEVKDTRYKESRKTSLKSAKAREKYFSMIVSRIPHRRMSADLKEYILLLEKSNEIDLPRLYEAACQFQDKDRAIALDLLALVWGDINPIGAAEFANTIANPEQSEEFLVAVFSRWPENLIQQGLNWIATIKDDAKKQRILESFLSNSARLEPHLVASYV
ncbi:MAG: hypothetical protein EAZ42_04330 [Verrucomicrobia bacterium]|nr:MAG: hypothetical protein EAZ42_04330 [Verrucomicrobiota bacterium]